MIAKNALLCAAAALAGCAMDAVVADEPAAEHPLPGEVRAERAFGSGAEALADVDENLARLRALDVFEVGALIVDMPEEASACYGPCPGSESVILAAKQDAALRLAELTVVAEAAINQPSSYLCTELVDENLSALRSLAIVEVAGLLVEEPTNNPQCYNLPCQADIDAANARNAARAAALDSIARAVTEI